MKLTKRRKIALAVVVGLIALCGFGAAMSGGDKPTTAADAAPVATAATAATATDGSAQPAAPAATTPAAPALTKAQQNAVRSARNYLDAMPFSRTGLIKQLGFEGYSTADATVAVDSMNIDYMTQAERAAANYTGMMGFSRSGLIKQLQFDGYTAEQAAHGADSVGL